MKRPTRRDQMRAENLTSYWDRTRWPLQSLYFLLPLLLIYEVGMWLHKPFDESGRLIHVRVSAQKLLNLFFDYFGVTGYYLPGILVVLVLLFWHLLRRDPWKPELALHGIMWIESLLLAIPLFVFMTVMFRQPTVAEDAAAWQSSFTGLLAGGSSLDSLPDWETRILIAFGAGIYEELLFRLIAIALLHLLLVDVCRVPDRWGVMASVTLAALAFALYHFDGFLSGDWEKFKASFELGRFVFYTLAGLYFAAIYVIRGFGIVAATHALYDLMPVATAYYLQPQA